MVDNPMPTHVEYMLTTDDNPFDPFTQYKEWYTWDVQAGYHTSSYLGRLLRTSESLSDNLQDRDYDEAIDSIIRENPYGHWIKVSAPENIPRRNV